MKIIILYSCCELAHSKTKDACCHVDGLKKNPPIWVPDTGVPATPLPPRTIQPNIPPGSDDCEAKDGMLLTIKFNLGISNHN